MRAIVCGGREYFRRARVWQILDAAVERLALTEIAEGGAPGADTDARLWAMERGVPFKTYKAAWHRHGLAAGPLRNAEMLREFSPDKVIAFPGGSGTADMVRRAERAGVPVIKVDWQ